MRIRNETERLVLLACLVIAAVANCPTFAHPGNGIFIDAKGDIYFTATHPIEGPQHHGCVWKLKHLGESRFGDAELVYKARHFSSIVYFCLGLDGQFYGAERNFLGEDDGKDAFEAVLWTLGKDGKTKKLRGPTRGRRPFGGEGILIDERGTFYFATDLVVMKREAAGKETVFAGSSSGLKDGRGKDAQFSRVGNMAWGPDGSIFVLDRDAVRVVDSSGEVSTLAVELKKHKPEEHEGVLGNGTILMDLAVDQDGNAYVADWGRKRVLKVTKSGEKAGSISTVLQADGHYSPEGLVHTNGALYVLESTAPPQEGIVPRIRMLKADGSVSIAYEYKRR